MDSIREPALISIGGNALTGGKGKETIPDQRKACEIACKIVAKVFQQVKTALTHGNGPQSGYIARRFEFAQKHGVLHGVPFDAIVADTQGALGYMIEQLLYNELIEHSPEQAKLIATLVTEALVDPSDPAFQNPSKPIGSWMTEAEAQQKKSEEGWDVREMDNKRPDGWRRVVSSPKPVAVTNEEAIKHNVNGGYLTICGGGGGIPVVKNPDGSLKGVEGVIDKDSISALIARIIQAKMLAILTAAPGVIDPVEFERVGVKGRIIPVLRLDEAKDMLPNLQDGSMGPKVAACVDFTENTGEPSVIANFENAEDALQGRAGTRIVA